MLSEERVITADTLRRFIPQDEDSTELATINSTGKHSFENERELIYKILYELRGSVKDLRAEMNNLIKQFDEARGLSGASGFASPVIDSEGKMPILPSTSAAPRPATASGSRPDIEEAQAEEIRSDEPETLNLNDLNRQMVEKALERNGGNRKKAARELGISDRTLYRRIKQYGLGK